MEDVKKEKKGIMLKTHIHKRLPVFTIVGLQ